MRLRLLVEVIVLALMLVPLAGCSGQEGSSQEAVVVEELQDAAPRDVEDDDADEAPELDEEGEEPADAESSGEQAESQDEDEADDADSDDSPDIRSLDTLDSYRQTMTTRTVSDGVVRVEGIDIGAGHAHLFSGLEIAPIQMNGLDQRHDASHQRGGHGGAAHRFVAVLVDGAIQVVARRSHIHSLPIVGVTRAYGVVVQRGHG